MKRVINKQNWTKIEVSFPYCMSFDDVYTWFKNELKNYEPGTILIGSFNGTNLNSNMTEDELWLTYWGKTKKEELLEREERNKEMEKWAAQAKKEQEEREKEFESWAITNYGSVEKYHQHIIDKLCEEGEKVIQASKMDDWIVTVTKNYDRSEVREVLHYLKRINEVDNPETIFPELKEYMYKQNHSGTTANWVLSCIEHYGGEIGKKLSQYIR